MNQVALFLRILLLCTVSAAIGGCASAPHPLVRAFGTSDATQRTLTGDGQLRLKAHAIVKPPFLPGIGVNVRTDSSRTRWTGYVFPSDFPRVHNRPPARYVPPAALKPADWKKLQRKLEKKGGLSEVG